MSVTAVSTHAQKKSIIGHPHLTGAFVTVLDHRNRYANALNGRRTSLERGSLAVHVLGQRRLGVREILVQHPLDPKDHDDLAMFAEPVVTGRMPASRLFDRGKKSLTY